MNLSFSHTIINWFKLVFKRAISTKSFKEFEKYSSKSPSLTIVGVGPGDPKLLTLAAIDAIKNATLISYPITNYGEVSMAAKIASSWITKDKKQLPLLFPMVVEEEPRKKAWRDASDQLIKALDRGEIIAFLSQGDISLFSTGAYVYLSMKKYYPKYAFEIIPGITSFSAAAAIGQFPLSLENEQLLILSTPNNVEELREVLQDLINYNRVIVLLKLGKRWEWVQPLLKEMDLLKTAIFAKKIGFDDQEVINAIDIPASSKPYFSLLLIRKSMPRMFY